MALLLLSPRPALATPVINIETPPAYVKLVPEFHKPLPDFDKEVLVPLKAKQEEAKKVEEKRLADLEAARIAAEIAARPKPAPVVYYAPAPRMQLSEGLTGSIGYSLPYGNCVNEPGINRMNGNPINWPATSRAPWIGATALFYFNHAAVVTGLWSNGDIEVRHQNAPGAPHRYPASMIRGYR